MRRRHDPEQAEPLQFDAALVGAKAAEEIEPGLDRAGGFDQQLEEGHLALRQVEGVRAQPVGERGVAVHPAQVEEDVDAEQILGL